MAQFANNFMFSQQQNMANFNSFENNTSGPLAGILGGMGVLPNDMMPNYTFNDTLVPPPQEFQQPGYGMPMYDQYGMPAYDPYGYVNPAGYGQYGQPNQYAPQYDQQVYYQPEGQYQQQFSNIDPNMSAYPLVGPGGAGDYPGYQGYAPQPTIPGDWVLGQEQTNPRQGEPHHPQNLTQQNQGRNYQQSGFSAPYGSHETQQLASAEGGWQLSRAEGPQTENSNMQGKKEVKFRAKK